MYYVSVCEYELRLVNKTSYIITVGLSFGVDRKNVLRHKDNFGVIKHKVFRWKGGYNYQLTFQNWLCIFSYINWSFVNKKLIKKHLRPVHLVLDLWSNYKCWSDPVVIFFEMHLIQHLWFFWKWKKIHFKKNYKYRVEVVLWSNSCNFFFGNKKKYIFKKITSVGSSAFQKKYNNWITCKFKWTGL